MTAGVRAGNCVEEVLAELHAWEVRSCILDRDRIPRPDLRPFGEEAQGQNEA
jgi:hypothetical protein